MFDGLPDTWLKQRLDRAPNDEVEVNGSKEFGLVLLFYYISQMYL